MRAGPVLALLLFTAPAAAGSVAPVDEAACTAMKVHHVLNEGAPVGCDRLAVVTFSYVDFDGREHDDGKIVVMDALAGRVSRIFDMLHARGFALAKAKPIEAYDGDDEASMADDNTSSFNDRRVGGSINLSLHAYGAAIDLNPVENPFITHENGTANVHPSAAAAFVKRSQAARGGAEAVVAIFAANGFTVWGGAWHDPIDYQHFDIGRPLAEKLARLPRDEARVMFEAGIGSHQP